MRRGQIHKFLPPDFIRTSRTSLVTPLSGELERLHRELIRLSREVLRSGGMPLLRARLPRSPLARARPAAAAPAASAGGTPASAKEPDADEPPAATSGLVASIAADPQAPPGGSGPGEPPAQDVAVSAVDGMNPDPVAVVDAAAPQELPGRSGPGEPPAQDVAVSAVDEAAPHRRLPPRGERGRFVARTRG